jgi:anhydro-N-acetylmuramic acid kinase
MENFEQNYSKPDPETKMKIIGLHSGNSGNGFDLTLLEISGSGLNTEFRILHTCHQDYLQQQKQCLEQIRDPRQQKHRLIGRINADLTTTWAETVRKMLARIPCSADSIELIGLQGPLIAAAPATLKSAAPGMSPVMQPGDPATLARLTGITTIGDFYLADLAAGGQGRPLLPYLDWLFFSRSGKKILLVDISNLTSCTYIPADGDKLQVRAFAAGPGNGLLDQLMQRLYELPFDRDGVKAGLGTLSEKLFGYLQQIDNYPEQSPAGSGGHGQYGIGFVLSLLRQALRWRIPEPDIIHTVNRYICSGVWKACKDFIPGGVQEIVLCGSGSQNIFLKQVFQEYFQPVPVRRSSDYGLPEDFREAIAAAILAHECIEGVPANLPGLTGADKAVVLGKIFPAGKNRF